MESMVPVTSHPKRLSPAEQLKVIRGWRIHEWRLTNEPYDKAEAAIKRLPQIIPPGAVIQLVPYLPRSVEGRVPVQYTFQTLWNRARFQFSEYHESVLFGDFSLVISAPGNDHKVGLRWEIIDLTANPQGNPFEVGKLRLQTKTRSPNAGLLALAAVQPDVFKSVDKVVLLLGYKMTTIFDRITLSDWAHLSGIDEKIGSIPTLSYSRGDPGINLSYAPLALNPKEEAEKHPDYQWIIPSFVEF